MPPRPSSFSPESAAARAALWYAPEEEVVRALRDSLDLPRRARSEISARARGWVERLRTESHGEGPLAALLVEYGLSSREGIALMCIAEALLRVPDAETADALISGQLAGADWETHLGGSQEWFVNASTRVLMMTGAVISPEEGGPILRQMIRRLGEPVVRGAIRACVSFLGGRFIYARNIERGLARARGADLCSFDMLGEAAWTAEDAARYTSRYADAIDALAAAREKNAPVFATSGVSVKLSALHPRFSPLQPGRFFDEILPRLRSLASRAAAADIPLCLDAEESDRLELTLEAFASLALDAEFREWEGLGMAIQAYSPRALSVAREVTDLGRRRGARLKPRLVKGAYWDTEIKRAQEGGFESYPTFTRKSHTDLSFLAVSSEMLSARDVLRPCFATHNAHTASALLYLGGASMEGWEFQRLHGMGERLHEMIGEVINEEAGDSSDPRETVTAPRPGSRIYAPVGAHRDLLAYLVRRLLENGANSSFVHRLSDSSVPIGEVVQDPLDDLASGPGLATPPHLYAPRRNSAGRDLAYPAHAGELLDAVAALRGRRLRATARVGGEAVAGDFREVVSPADISRVVGEVSLADADSARLALERAWSAYFGWRGESAAARAECLRRAALAMEARLADFAALLAAEAGRTLADGVSEVREAVDFLRYYADEAERLGAGVDLPGPTGERNRLTLEGRGPFLCISPWNFPLAIFVGQVAAALAAGCSVLAKPASATVLVAHEAILLLEAAGVPGDVLHFLPGGGAEIGDALLGDSRLAGVAFTGSGEVARGINRRLAARDGPIGVLIAETGGVNAMVADSSALPEQLTRDVLSSAFRSAGQRCSALRVLYLQEDSADEQQAMLLGAVRELRVGDPGVLETDVGPLIGAGAVDEMRSWGEYLSGRGSELLARADPGGGGGYYFAPEVWSWSELAPPVREVFGPILHVSRWRDFDEVLGVVNASGFGLTFSLHSRCVPRIERVSGGVEAGNVYINRDQVGAVVGVNPFGGRGLSGTGPKAGGPSYVQRFMTERVVTTDLTASGGNASLLAIAS
ncbi:MAG: bifunctional proline dehydrogenase/L-glutamate gamma-semialdehyde dehydrogenase PutA [Alphaproteobacteria bacterium]|nr:bifunctional proline dehydrogenase/L-glutamate gamma-semialdehyde dehydrogenase PutA [Alphaproteobacteria bacterium]